MVCELNPKINLDSLPGRAKAATAMTREQELPIGRAALIIAHPGHELCVYGWCKRARPLVFILTDGSGRTGLSRTERSVRLLDRLGCTAASISGGFTDRELYQALLDCNHDLFTNLATNISQQLVLERVDYVVGDAGEGFNPIHDVCRLIIDAALVMAGRVLNRTIPSFEFRLDWRKVRQGLKRTEGTKAVVLDQETFASKLSAARAYAELDLDVQSALRDNGIDSFRVERLNPVLPARHRRQKCKPYYEEYGERSVAAGIYNQVIRYQEHLAPVRKALRVACQGGL